MYTIINYVLLLVYLILTVQIFSPRFNKQRVVKLPKPWNGTYQINKTMYYLIFVVCTAPFFLGELSLMKYLVYFLALIVLIGKGKIRTKADGIVKAYFLFFLWMLLSLMWSDYKYSGMTMVLKLSIPIFSLWLGYSAIQNEKDFFFFANYSVKWAVVYSFFVGGLSAVLTPWLYFNLGNTFITYAGLADYYTSLFPLCFALAWITHQKNKNYFKAFLLLLSTLLEVVRTGLGGMILGSTVFSIYKYKAKAIPVVIGIVVMAFGILLYVPSVNQKFFKGGEGATATQMSRMTADDIQTNGRAELWLHFMDRFYEPSPITGSGLGTSSGYLKDKVNGYTESGIQLLHSDYVQILCDSGMIGLGLFVLFVIVVMVKTIRASWNGRSMYTRISAMVAASSLIGVAFSMGFDNVLSHSMTSLINPFIFIGFFLKFIDLERR